MWFFTFLSPQPHAVITLRAVYKSRGCTHTWPHVPPFIIGQKSLLHLMAAHRLWSPHSWAFHINLPSTEMDISLWHWGHWYDKSLFFIIPFKYVLPALLLVIHEFSRSWVKRGILHFSLGHICCLRKEVAASIFLFFSFTLLQLVCSPFLCLLINWGARGNISCCFSLQMLYSRLHLLQLSPAIRQLNKDTLHFHAVIR